MSSSNSSSSSLPTIGFIGIGLMGRPMVTNLLKAGYSVCVWNRTRDKADSVLLEGATWSEEPADLAMAVDIVILMLTDAGAVTDVLVNRGVAGALRPGALVIDMSSIPPAAARTHAQLLCNRAVEHVDAPVSGGTKGAASRNLAIMVGGTEMAFARAKPVLCVLGRPTRVGASGTGQVAKLANQVIVAISIEAVAEAFAFAARSGADPYAVRSALAGGFADSRILAEHGARMLEANFVPGGTVRNQIKDLDAALAVANECNLVLPLLTETRARFEMVANAGGAELDHSAVYKLFNPAVS